jgi:hypothetical protein
MSRLNLTLDDVTFRRLGEHAKKGGGRRTALARQLVREGLDRRDALDRRKRLAADYAAGRADARELLKDFETAQLEMLDVEKDA